MEPHSQAPAPYGPPPVTAVPPQAAPPVQATAAAVVPAPPAPGAQVIAGAVAAGGQAIGQLYYPHPPPVPAQQANPAYGARLQSEKVVVAAPLSFAGSAARIWKITQVESPGAKVALACVAILLIACAWTVVLSWYSIFGLWVVPYRLIRRGSRQRKRQALQHREMMAAIQQQQPPYYR
jgi:hypothetical protein